MNFLRSLLDQAHLAPAFKAVILAVMVLGALATVACILLVVHHGYTSTRRSRRGRLVERATPLLAPHIATGEGLSEAVAESRRLHGDWATAIVLRESRHEIRGERADQLTRALIAMGEVRRLKALAASRQDWRRSQAVRELGQCGGDEARALLLEATRDPEPDVRRAAREGLLNDGRPDSVKAAIHSYVGDAPAVTAKRSFYSQLAEVAGDDLRDLLHAGGLDSKEEKLALEALGESRNADVLPLARERLVSPEPEIRATAARVVGKLADHESCAALAQLLDDKEWYVRAAAAKAFETVCPDAEAQRLLAARLNDEAWWVRANAAHALAQQGDAGADALLLAADGTDNYSRDAALSALGLAMLTPAARQRLQGRMSRIEDASRAAPLRRLFEAVPAGAGA